MIRKAGKCSLPVLSEKKMRIYELQPVSATGKKVEYRDTGNLLSVSIVERPHGSSVSVSRKQGSREADLEFRKLTVV